MGMAAVHFRVESLRWDSYNPDHTQRILPSVIAVAQWVAQIEPRSHDWITRLLYALPEEEHSLVTQFFAMYGPAGSARFAAEIHDNHRDMTIDIVIMVSFEYYNSVVDTPGGGHQIVRRLHPTIQRPQPTAPPPPPSQETTPPTPALRLRQALRGR